MAYKCRLTGMRAMSMFVTDWVVKNDKPHYGLKEHAAVDTSNGFVLATELTPSSVNDSIYLPYCVAASCHTEDQIKKVKEYRQISYQICS